MEQNDAQDSKLDDFALMRAIHGGDDTALARLFDRYAPIVLALCIRILNDRTAAEEVLDDVFWELWERSDRYRVTRSSPRTYILMLSRSRAIDRLRSEQKNRENVSRKLDRDGDTMTSNADTWEGDTPLDRTIDKELRDYLQNAIQSLDTAKRQAIEMSFFQGFSHSDIAEHLDQPVGTIKSRIRNGLIHLRQTLRTYYSSQEHS